MIDAQFVKRGKTVSARRLHNNAKKLDAWFVDYRNLGYVTEVKDQVRHFYICLSFVLSRLNHEHLHISVLNVLHRVTVAHAGPSALQGLLRDRYIRGQVSLYPWVSKTWWTAPDHMVPMAAMVPGWPMPTIMWWTTGCSRQAPIHTPQWWGCRLYLYQGR